MFGDYRNENDLFQTCSAKFQILTEPSQLFDI